MPRTVITIQSMGGTNCSHKHDLVSVELDETFDSLRIDEDAFEFICPCDAPPIVDMTTGNLQPGTVRDAGQFLYERLAAHPTIMAVLDAIRDRNELAPIYFHIKSNHGEVLPWEALYHPASKTFLALKRNWPIGRIAGSTALGLPVERMFAPPLRITVILGAAGVDARPEWDALWSEIQAVPVAVELQVFVVQDDLRAEITSHVGRGVRSVAFIPEPKQRGEMFGAISNFVPNILHFFCHGEAVESNPLLLVATRISMLTEANDDILQLGPEDIYESANLGSHTWLVVLNCCEGALASRATRSFVRSLVTRGVPAAIGMREVVPTVSAHMFCRTLYRELLQKITPLGAPGSDPTELEWASLLHSPREWLSNQQGNAAASKEWTLPAVYVRRSIFRLKGPSTSSKLTAEDAQRLQGKIDTLREQRGFIAARTDMFPSEQQQLLQRIDEHINQLELRLYPQSWWRRALVWIKTQWER